MKTLVICRHAKSDWSLDLPDFDRPLNARGLKDAPRMGRMLAQHGFNPDLILSSPAKRALTTAKLIAAGIGYKGEIQEQPAFYDNGHGAALGVIQNLDHQYDTVMVFGHNPTWEALAQMLLGSQGHIIMPTCAMICLQAPVGTWKDLGATASHLKWFLIPKITGEE